MPSSRKKYSRVHRASRSKYGDRPGQLRADVNRVYYPEAKNPAERLKVSTKRKWRVSAVTPRTFDVYGKQSHYNALTAPRICGRRCLGITTRGTECHNSCCVDYRYCAAHLLSIKHLVVAPSRRLASLGVHGALGLYAMLDKKTLQSQGKDQYGAPNISRNVVFKKGQLIDYYGGEVIKKQEYDQRYDAPDGEYGDETGAYATEGITPDTTMDALSAATASSYSNDPIDIGKLWEQSRTVDQFYDKYRKKAQKVSIKDPEAPNAFLDDPVPEKNLPPAIYAKRDIYSGEEITWPYGAVYWTSSGNMALFPQSQHAQAKL